MYVAHDDDAILGVGGKILQHINDKNDVYIIIFTDGRNSHKAVLGIENNPSVWEVKQRRKEEMERAMDVIGVDKTRLYFLDLADGSGDIWQNRRKVIKRATDITDKEKPDIVYFHYPDAHPDHRAVNKIVRKILENQTHRPESYQFPIWTKELAENRTEVNSGNAAMVPENVIRIDIRKELDAKRKALFKMKSQIEAQPYPGWQVQVMPILNGSFVEYFLRGEEILIRYQKQKNRMSNKT